MKRVIKIVSIIVLILILLFIFLNVGLNVFVKPEFMRNKITQIVSQKLHREVSIKGNLSWSLFPRVKINVSQFQMNNPEGFLPNNTPFLTIQELDLGLNLFSLLVGEIEVNHLTLNGLNANLIVNNHKMKNWEFAVTNPQSKKNNQNKNTVKEPLKLKIDSIDIEHSAISYTDLSQNQSVALSNLSMNAAHIRPNTPFNIAASSDFDAGKNGAGQVSFSTEVLFDSKYKHIQLGNFQSTMQLKLQNMKPLKISESGSAIIDREKQHMSITAFNADVDAAHLSGEIESNLQGSTPVVLAKMTIAKFNPRSFISLLNQSVPAFENADAFTTFSGNVEIQASPNTIQFNQFQFTLDESTLSGSAGITDLNKKIFQFVLNLDQVDLDRYKLKSNTESGSSKNTSSNPSSSSGAPSPLTLWSGVGNLTIGSIKTSKLALNNTSMNLSASQGVFNFNPIKTRLFKGNYIGQFVYNSRASSFNLKGALTGVDGQALLQALQPLTKVQISGKADINEALTTQGASVNEFVRNLNGNVLFVFNNGVWYGMDIPYYYALGKAMLSSQTSTNVKNTHQTQFGNLTGSFDIQQGVAINKDLLLQGPILQAKGSGSVDLAHQQVNYQLIMLSNAIGNFEIPLKITGSFDNLSIFPDIKEIAKKQIQQQVQKQVQKQLQTNVSKVLEKNLGKNTSDAIVSGISGLLQKQ